MRTAFSDHPSLHPTSVSTLELMLYVSTNVTNIHVAGSSTPWWIVAVPAIAALGGALVVAFFQRGTELAKWKRDAVVQASARFLRAVGEVEHDSVMEELGNQKALSVRDWTRRILEARGACDELRILDAGIGEKAAGVITALDGVVREVVKDKPETAEARRAFVKTRGDFAETVRSRFEA
jgi:hypothetical protein